MQFRHLGYIHPGLLLNLGAHGEKKGVNDKIGISFYALDHRRILITLQGIDVKFNHIVENITETVDEVDQDLGSVESHDVIDKAEDELAETDGGIAEIDKTTVMDEVTEILHSKVLHFHLNG